MTPRDDDTQDRQEGPRSQGEATKGQNAERHFGPGGSGALFRGSWEQGRYTVDVVPGTAQYPAPVRTLPHPGYTAAGQRRGAVRQHGPAGHRAHTRGDTVPWALFFGYSLGRRVLTRLPAPVLFSFVRRAGPSFRARPGIRFKRSDDRRAPARLAALKRSPRAGKLSRNNFPDISASRI